ncbi:amidase [Ktedonosporobacter rubrisoli]|uniref:Amidase n=1 Tax=Ktedonosporobacter rubrisoli TaxID=2509675 RepID=A0A4P6K0E2_KTERU|nr:amidase [Ktedonosporobacter rubrisoli]QBD81658.1 amidase [Ktedonosporobacter rubrisoli]
MPSPFLASLPLAPTAAALRSDQRELVSYIEDTCQRIESLDDELQALLPEARRCERLLSEAQALQQRFPDPAQRPPLYGVLVGIKDMFHVSGFPTSAGSQLPASELTGEEASCVSKLRAAGALVLGKTVTTEMAYFEPGLTRNPHNLQYSPGGSSSGSAAAVAAGFCALALGTQTIGSTIRPAAFCGIVGFKPTYGRISEDGLILCSPSVDTVGIFTQDVAGSALAASWLCHDWRAVSLKDRPVLGIPEGPYLAQASSEGQAAFAGQVEALERAGYRVQRVPALPDISEINLRHRNLVHAEMAREHATWFARYEGLYRPRTAQAIRAGQTIKASDLAAARAGRAKLRAELEALIQRHEVDLWISPAAPGPAPEGITTTGDAIMNLPWTHAGLPAINLPAGYAANGLPLGLQVVGKYMADEQLLGWASELASVVVR